MSHGEPPRARLSELEEIEGIWINFLALDIRNWDLESLRDLPKPHSKLHLQVHLHA